MPSLRLESVTDKLDLDYVAKNGNGIQVLSGVTGLGLPPVARQWLEGARDGAIPRGRRVLPRDIDLPLLIQARDRAELEGYVERVASMVEDACTLYFVADDRGDEWYAEVYRVGGGGYAYGVDTDGETELLLVITLRAGDPYFTSTRESKATITSSASRGLLSGGSLVSMKISSGQAIGTITLDNPGDAAAWPVWKVYGPGNNFLARSVTGEQFHWEGSLGVGDILTIDSKSGLVTDQLGDNRFDDMATMPRFWSVPKGLTRATASLAGVSAGVSKIECTWRARKWMVI